MPRAPRHRHRAGAALGAALAVGLFVASPAHAATSQTAVFYLGHQFDVPTTWQVVNLTDDPTACVRFDVHAVYLGTPGAHQNCPSRVLGKTDALLVSPASATAAASASEDATSHQITSTAAGISVTAAYSASASQITDILAGAGLPQPRATQNALTPRSTTTSGVVANSLTNYTGAAFDACSAPDSGTMSTWLTASPYRAVGIYIGGVNRGCSQPNLTAAWVTQQASAGWHFFPLYVGPQGSGACSSCAAITSPASQAAAAADDAVVQAQALGIGPGNPIYYDMEAYPSTQSIAVLTFMSTWTAELHAKGYLSGEYSSLNSGIADLVDNGASYLMPDVIDFASWDNVNSTTNATIPSGDWANHQRLHQYSGGHNETYGGVTINIDGDAMDIGLPSQTAPPFSMAATAMPDGSMHIDELVDGVLYDNIRFASGAWQGWQAPGRNAAGTPSMIALAGMKDGSMHVDELVNGVLYDNIRFASGAWQGWQAPGANAAGTPSLVQLAPMPDGTLHVDELVNGVLYDNIRFTNGLWQGWEAPGANAAGTPSVFQLAPMPDGSLHVDELVNGALYDNIRFASGPWQGWEAPGANTAGTPSTFTLAHMPDGSMHVDELVNGAIYDNIRFSNGSWQGWRQMASNLNGAPALFMTTGMPDGTLHVDELVNGGVYDNIRFTSGAWQGWRMIGANPAGTP